MSETLNKFRKNYADALGNYLVLCNEEALAEAYHLGRWAVQNKLGILEMAASHRESLIALLRQASSMEESAATGMAAENFFAEALAPFEMTQRGFQEANNELKELNRRLESRVTERTRALRDSQRQLRQSLRRLHGTLDQVIQTITVIGEIRDPYTTGHEARVADMAVTIARELRLPAAKIEGLRVAALLHDIGKVAVPIEILTKPGGLTDYEMQIIRTHPRVGHDILRNIDFPWPVAEMVLQSHERLDGSGYPRGLKDVKIMVEARILAAADVVEAMVSHRPYRPALGVDAAFEELEAGKGKRYDRKVVEVCRRLIEGEKSAAKLIKRAA